MDPVTQGALGAAVAVAVLPRLRPYQREPWSLGRIALIGALGGMAPDLDILIRSDTDGLLAIEYHRHFTHSLAFIPVGGALAALPWLAFGKWRQAYRGLLGASILGYATHAILDACTTYGTLLFWPFSKTRVSLSYISVVDLIYTLPLLAGLVAALRWKRPIWALAGLAWGQLYIGLGAFQKHQALTAQSKIAEQRGHVPERAAVFPSIANNVTWRAVYEHQGQFYVDKIRIPWGRAACVSPGTSVPALRSEGPTTPEAQRAYQLLLWFADGWAAFDPEQPAILSDLRYSFSPTEIAPIWGVQFSRAGVPIASQHETAQATHGTWVNHRGRRGIELEDLERLWFEDEKDARCF